MINKNPFYILELTTRNNRQKIVEMAEDKSLEIDEDVCQNAQSTLTTPSKRITAEVDWFPGVSPARIEKILSSLNTGNMDEVEQYGLTSLAQVNILLEILHSDKINLSMIKLKAVVEDIVGALGRGLWAMWLNPQGKAVPSNELSVEQLGRLRVVSSLAELAPLFFDAFGVLQKL